MPPALAAQVAIIQCIPLTKLFRGPNCKILQMCKGLEKGRGEEETYHERVTHLLVEGGWKEFDHVCEPEQEGGGQVTKVSQHHQQRSKGRVN